MDYSVVLHPSGAIDLKAGNNVLTGIVSYINEKPIVSLSVDIGDDTIVYRTNEGVFCVHVYTDEHGIVISTSYDTDTYVHDVEPIGFAGIEGIEKIYVQGFGMEGPSGVYSISDDVPVSHGLTGLSGKGGAAAVFALDHSRYDVSFAAGTEKTMYHTRKYLSCGIDLEGTYKKSDRLPDIHIIAGTDVVECMETAARMIAESMHARNVLPPAYNWCSWYYYYENMSQQRLDELIENDRKDPCGFRYIQVDAGYTDHTGDWTIINDRYPGGLRQAARTILDAGYKAGIWIAPFMVGDESVTYKEHPDWIIRNKDGSPYVVFRSYTEPKIWGNTDNDYYVLDTTNKEAFSYIEGIFRDLRSYGFTLFKIDFLLWCMVDSSRVSRADDSKTSVEILRELLAMIRETAGADSYVLASIAPYMASIGYADGVRIAGDMGAAWDGPYGPANLLHEMPYVNYFNNIFWQNDPDAVILRDTGTHLSDRETISLALLQALSGGVITTSDPVQLIKGDRRKLLEFIRPPEKPVHAVFHGITGGQQVIVITHTLHDWNLLYVLNTTERPISVFFSIKELFGTEALFQYRFNWKDDKVAGSEKISYFSDSIDPHDSVLLFLTEGPLSERPSNLWCRDIGFTSNHN